MHSARRSTGTNRQQPEADPEVEEGTDSRTGNPQIIQTRPGLLRAASACRRARFHRPLPPFLIQSSSMGSSRLSVACTATCTMVRLAVALAVLPALFPPLTRAVEPP